MHKFKINKYKWNKLIISKLELLLLINMVFLDDLKKQKIKFNPKPFSNPNNNKKNFQSQKTKVKKVDMHLDIINKIDELIQENKGLTKIIYEPHFSNTKKTSSPLSNIIEIRGSGFKKPEMPMFRNELKPNNFNNSIGQSEEFFEVELQKVNTNKKENNEEGRSWMFDEKEENKKFKASDGENKIQSKELNDVVTKTQLDLERTKKDIEEKKLALENALKEEKQKEIELKKIKEIKQKEEKLKKLELKKKLKEEKIKHRELIKIQKEKVKELKNQEKFKLNETENKKIETLKKEPEIFEIHKIEPDIIKTETVIDLNKEPFKGSQILDQDVVKLMPILDSLFEYLPENVVQEFVQSKDFEIYERVMLKYKNK